MHERLFSGTQKARGVLERVKSIVRTMVPAYILMHDVDSDDALLAFLCHRVCLSSSVADFTLLAVSLAFMSFASMRSSEQLPLPNADSIL